MSLPTTIVSLMCDEDLDYSIAAAAELAETTAGVE